MIPSAITASLQAARYDADVKKLLITVVALAAFGCVTAQGVPATSLQEFRSGLPDLPWLAYRFEAQDCAHPSGNTAYLELNEGIGCYTVPDTPADLVLWGLTQALRETGRWELLDEYAVGEDEQAAVVQYWRDKLLTKRIVRIEYLLTPGAEKRFYIDASSG